VPVALDIRGRVALLTIDRPEALNAISQEVLDALQRHLDAIQADGSVRAAVVTGGGEKAFSAGADVNDMREATREQARAFAQRGQFVLARIESFPKPVIAAVNGYALGGGCELALACDVRLAAEGARFAQPEVNLGILPGWGATQRLPRLTSPGFAKEMIFTGRMVGADEALRSGLVNRVLPREDLVDAAVAMGEEIAAKSAAAVAASKALVNRALDGELDGNLAREVDAFAHVFTTHDQREGMAAFFEKRAPRFEPS